MRIMKLAYEGVKGQRRELAFDKPCFAAIGPMGCGKSAALDALHLALNLPTPFGSTGLERLSPNGIWSVRVELEGDSGPTAPTMLLERELKRGRAGCRVNGIQVDRKEYEDAIKTVLDVEPHHVRLGEFMSLSGQRRAALFAGMLEAPATSLGEYMKDPIPDETMECLGGDMLARLRAIRGTPAVITDAVKAFANEMNQRWRDSKARLEGLEQRTAGVSHGRSVAQVQAEIQRIDTEMGAVAERRRDAELQKGRFEAAKRVLDEARHEERRSGEALQKAVKTIASILDLEGDINRARATGAKAKEDEIAHLTAEKQATQSRDDAEKTCHSIDNAIDMLRRIHEQPWEIDELWMHNRLAALLAVLGTPAPSIPPGAKDSAVQFARDVVTQAFGGEIAVLSAKRGEADRVQDEMDHRVLAERSAVSAALNILRAAAQDENLAVLKMSAANEVKSRIDTISKDATSAVESRAAMEAEFTQLQVGQDVRTIEADEVRLRGERQGLATQLTELQEANAISGQVEEARVAVKKGELATMWLQGLGDRVQRARDESVRRLMEAMWNPFRETFAAIFGRPIELTHESSGVGRSTEFTFSVPIKGRLVPLDMLSDGETALTAMAFLAALQRVKKGPGTILTLNAEALDAAGMALLLAGAPKLGMDFVMLTSNRLVGADIPADWCFAQMEK